MKGELKIRIRTLTPLWTGGVDGTCDRLHETGLIGSLRWWYEAIVRGLGGYACDPTEHSCRFDEKKYRKSQATSERERLLEAGVCDACQLFGCTGWARRFRLRVSGGKKFKKFYEGPDVLIPSGGVRHTKKGPHAGGWLVFSESRVGEIIFEVIPSRNADLRPIHTILALISRHATLGPKRASGYGVIQAEVETHDLSWTRNFGSNPPPRNNALPDFRDFFFARFRFHEPVDPNWWQKIEGIRQAVKGELDNGNSVPPLRKALSEIEQMYKQGVLPIAPAIRNWLRFRWQHGLSDKEAHFIFGEAQAVCPHCYKSGFKSDKQDEKKFHCPNCGSKFSKGQEIPPAASKIFVSYAYRVNDAEWEFRIW